MDLRYSLLRLGRHFLWRFPSLYLPIGTRRGRVPVCASNFDLWVGGFPRSGNTYLWKMLERIAPERRIAGHFHIPALVIRAIKTGRPGILVMRAPTDAAISWSAQINRSGAV